MERTLHPQKVPVDNLSQPRSTCLQKDIIYLLQVPVGNHKPAKVDYIASASWP